MTFFSRQKAIHLVKWDSKDHYQPFLVMVMAIKRVVNGGRKLNGNGINNAAVMTVAVVVVMAIRIEGT